MYYLYSILCLLLVQTRSTPAGGTAAATTSSAAGTAGTTGGTGAAQAPPSFFESMIYFLPAMLAMMLVYMLIMKPQAKPGARSGDLPELKKNDRVVTAGGIVGTVIKSESEFTTLRVDESGSTKMQFLTSSIAKLLNDEKDGEKSSGKK